jgi:hypothetical protein
MRFVKEKQVYYFASSRVSGQRGNPGLTEPECDNVLLGQGHRPSPRPVTDGQRRNCDQQAKHHGL